MRNKIAKQIRRQALVQAVSDGLPYLDYTFKWFNKFYTDPLTGMLKGYKVCTVSMEACQKKVYKQMKKQFKEGK